MSVRIIQGDCLEELRKLPDASVHCCVTSPPYWGLRDYGVAGQIGMEPTPAQFVATMVAVFKEVHRVLRDDGTLWLNLGDSYHNGDKVGYVKDRVTATDSMQRSNLGANFIGAMNRQPQEGLKPKDLCGMPWRVAFALQADGWYLRQDIIWAKPNPMPESVRDRCTKSHEYLFLLAKSERYYFDNGAIAEPATWAADTRNGDGRLTYDGKRQGGSGQGQEAFVSITDTRNKRSVWTVATQPFKDAHFATFPPRLIEPCILAGCPAECCEECGAPMVNVVDRKPAEVMSPGSGYGNGAGRNDGNRSMLVGAKATVVGKEPSCSCGVGFVCGTVIDPFGGRGDDRPSSRPSTA